MADKTEILGRLSAADRDMMLNAKAEVDRAQGVWQFTVTHLNRVYRLEEQGADVNTAGEIVRQVDESPAIQPVAEPVRVESDS